MAPLIVVAMVLVIAVLAPLLGADSRPGAGLPPDRWINDPRRGG